MGKKVKKIKFLHCADIHIDCPFSSLDSNLAKKRKQTLKDVFSNIINIALRECVDFLFICGDLFEQNYTDSASINFINECFKKLRNTKVLIACGNHDPAIKNSHYSTFEWNDNVIIFKSHISYAYFDESDTYVYGSSFTAFEESECTIPNFDLLDKNGINILLTHGTLNLGVEETKYNPLDFKFLQDLGMDYIALGHFHNKFIKENIYNPGSPEPLGFDECGKHGVFLATIDKTSDLKLDVQFIETNISNYDSLEINIPSIDNDLFVIDTIKNKLAKSIQDPSNTLLQILLKGYVKQGCTLDFDYINSSLSRDYLYIKIVNDTALDYDWDSIAKEPGIRGLFVSRMLRKISNEPDDAQKKILHLALLYGMQAIDNNKVEI